MNKASRLALIVRLAKSRPGFVRTVSALPSAPLPTDSQGVILLPPPVSAPLPSYWRAKKSPAAPVPVISPEEMLPEGFTPAAVNVESLFDEVGGWKPATVEELAAGRWEADLGLCAFPRLALPWNG